MNLDTGSGCRDIGGSASFEVRRGVDASRLMLDAQGRIVAWQPDRKMAADHPGGDLSGSDLGQLFQPADGIASSTARLMADVARSERLAVDGWRRRADGSRRRAVLLLSVLRDTRERLTGFAGILHDLAERQRGNGDLLSSQEDFRTAMDHAAVGMALVTPDGRWMQVNRSVSDLLGYGIQALCRLTFQQITHPEDLGPELRLLDDLLDGRIPAYRMQKRFLCDNGSWIWCLLAVSVVRDRSGAPDYLIVQIQDIEILKRAEEQLNAQRDRLQVTLRSIADGVISTDILGHIDFMNPAAESLTGCRLEQVRGQPHEAVFQSVDAETGQPLESPVRACLADDASAPRHQPAMLVSRDGDRREIHESAAPIRSEQGAIIGSVLVFQDVSNVRSLQKELEFSALHDELTGLPNRRKFEAVLEQAWLHGKTSGSEHTLCFLDLDRFKIINDSAGHAAGDLLLRMITQTLCKAVRPGDLVARLGGDEFALILFDCEVARAESVLGPIGDAIAAVQFPWEGRLHNVTASMGLASIGKGAESASMAMKQADVACHASKHAGRNRVSVYDAGHSEAGSQHRQLMLAAEIQGALAENRLRLCLQRIVATLPGQRPHYEVLLRLIDREGQRVSPAMFIGPAERYGLMGELDRWVCREILERQGARLALHPGLRLNVNLSGNSLNDPRFLPWFVDTLRHSPLAPDRMTLEITETAMINNLLTAGSVIESIRSLGCRIALDDFGTGLSSLSYLKAFKVDYLKIDGSFIRNLGDNAIDHTITRAIHSIAREIGVRTVAECVENADILQQVRDIGIDFAQGYALAMPMDFDVVLDDPSVDAADPS